MYNLEKNFENNKLHHSIMFLDIKGNGIYDKVLDLAIRILSKDIKIKMKIESFLDAEKDEEQEKQNWTKNLINNKEHPDFLLIEKDVKDKEIKIETIKKISDFIQLTPFVAKNKVIIINGVNEMNVKTQNSILKTIEEPQKNTYIFLICYNVNNILTTIKSRCQVVTFSKILYNDWRIKVVNGTQELYDISGGSIEYANKILENDGLEIFNKIKNLLKENSLNIGKLHLFCDEILKSKTEKDDKVAGSFDKYKFLTDLLLYYLYGILSKKIIDVFSKKNSEKMLLEKYKTIQTIIRDTNTLNLDKKHSIIIMFLELMK
jgi:DNA polymerase III delta prime subunit